MILVLYVDDEESILALTRRSLEDTGISISQTSSKGEGARFEIRVPPGTYRFT